MELTRRMGQPPACECGCGGMLGHILSTELQVGKCTAMTTDDNRVFHRCSKPAWHNDLVPHGDGEIAWYA